MAGRLRFVFLLAALILPGAGCGRSSDDRALTVVGWGGASQDAHREAYWRAFTETTATPLREDVWNGGVGVLRTKSLGRDPGWDVVQAETEEMILGCEEGFLAPVDWDMLGGKAAFFAPATHECGVGAMVWSQLFAYDGDRIVDPPASWADFWNVERWPGKRGMRRTPKYTLEAALMADGVSPGDVYPALSTAEGVERAFAALDRLKPHIVWWSSVSQTPNLLVSGEVAMTMATPGRLIVANAREGMNFKVVWTQNIYAVDFWVILANSPRKEDAMRLIAFMTSPENQSRLPQLIPTGPSNLEAIARTPPVFLEHTPLKPENIETALALDAEFWVEHGDHLTQRFNAWAAR